LTRAYDNPNSPYYGPARRLWVTLVGLCDLDLLDQQYNWEWGERWDTSMARLLAGGASEAGVARHILGRILDIYQEK
jgi:hypothetical protein